MVKHESDDCSNFSRVVSFRFYDLINIFTINGLPSESNPYVRR